MDSRILTSRTRARENDVRRSSLAPGTQSSWILQCEDHLGVVRLRRIREEAAEPPPRNEQRTTFDRRCGIRLLHAAGSLAQVLISGRSARITRLISHAALVHLCTDCYCYHALLQMAPLRRDGSTFNSRLPWQVGYRLNSSRAPCDPCIRICRVAPRTFTSGLSQNRT